MKTIIVNKVLVADDCALNATTKANMQNSIDKFSMACDNFSLATSTKRKQKWCTSQRLENVEPNITIKRQRLKAEEKFTYLGSTLSLSKSIVMDDEVNAWLEKRVQLLADSTRMCGFEEISRRCLWCNCYRRRKWTRRYEFKSWTKLIAFHIALIPLGKVWIQLFSLQLWVNSRVDWFLQPCWSN